MNREGTKITKNMKITKKRGWHPTQIVALPYRHDMNPAIPIFFVYVFVIFVVQFFSVVRQRNYDDTSNRFFLGKTAFPSYFQGTID